MWIGIITMIPEIFITLTNYGILSKALKNGNLILSTFNPKYFKKNFIVDYKPFGYFPGVLLNFESLKNVINYAKIESNNVNTKIIYLSPKGVILNQDLIIDILSYKSIIFISGKYEGIDERLFNFFIDYEISIGDFVLTGGEFAIMCFIDSFVRLLPNVLGNFKSILNDSFIDFILDSPHYSKPKLINNIIISNNLVSGNHFLIYQCCIKSKLGCTFFKRRDLFNKFSLSKNQYMLLRNFILENREVL